MNDNLNFYDLWQSQTSKPLPSDELLIKIKKLKKSNYRTIWFTSILFTVTSFFIIWIWIEYNPQLITTKLGIIIVLLSMLLYGYSLNQQTPLLKKIDELESSSEYLQNLLDLKTKQQYLQSTMLNLYFIFLSLGLGLYMIEPTSKMQFQHKLLAYGVTLSWILLNWFYIRPRQIKKQQTKLNYLISQLTIINKQLKD